jgi:pyrimidine operon attenuation protein / uracil phosphoribosyltransferase
MTSTKNYILNQSVAEKKLRRMALEIAEKNADEKQIILVGIKDNGAVIAESVQQHLAEICSIKTDMLTLSLNKQQPGEITLSKRMDFNDKVIIVIDDVADSGKTLLYALKPFLDYHPKKIQTLVLIERSHNSFPVHPDYIGLTVATTLQEHIFVEVSEGKVLGAYLK